MTYQAGSHYYRFAFPGTHADRDCRFSIDDMIPALIAASPGPMTFYMQGGAACMFVASDLMLHGSPMFIVWDLLS